MDGILLAWFHGRPKIQEGVMKKRYRVTLTESERVDLRKLVSVGKAAARRIVRARILLLADQAAGGPGKWDAESGESVGCGGSQRRAHSSAVRGRWPGRGVEPQAEPTGVRAK